MNDDTRHGIMVFCENGRFKFEYIERLTRNGLSFEDLDDQLRELADLIDNLRYFVYRAKEKQGQCQN